MLLASCHQMSGCQDFLRSPTSSKTRPLTSPMDVCLSQMSFADLSGWTRASSMVGTPLLGATTWEIWIREQDKDEADTDSDWSTVPPCHSDNDQYDGKVGNQGLDEEDAGKHAGDLSVAVEVEDIHSRAWTWPHWRNLESLSGFSQKETSKTLETKEVDFSAKRYESGLPDNAMTFAVFFFHIQKVCTKI